MRMMVIRLAVATALFLYVGIIGWLVLSEIPARMMAAALLSAIPLIVAAHQEMKEAAAGRQRVADEVRQLREELRRGRGEVL